MFVNLLTGFLGPVAALIIYLLYKDRSSRVAFNALQSMFYQIGWLVMIPVMAIVSVVPFVHAGYAVYRVSQGDDHRYPFAADIIERRWEEQRCAKLRWTRKERQATWETPPRSLRGERTEA
jgi:uncharacterized protein